MRLVDLNPRWFYGVTGVVTGVKFECPTCPPERKHSIIVPWAPPSPYRSGTLWELKSAQDFAVLTVAPSINCDVPPKFDPPGKWTDEEKAEIERTRCRFHGFIENGQVRTV